MSKLLVLIFGLNLIFSSVASANNKIAGWLYNDTPWENSELKYTLIWEKSCGYYEPHVCETNESNFTVNDAGKYEAQVKTGRSWFSRIDFYIKVDFPNGASTQINFDETLPEKSDLYLKYVPSIRLPVKMANGGSIEKWVKEEGFRIDYHLQISSDTYKAIFTPRLNEIVDDRGIVVQDLAILTNQDINQVKFTFHETAALLYDSGALGASVLFSRESTEVLNQQSFESRLGPIVLDTDAVNTSLTGDWKGQLLFHEFGRKLKMAVENSELVLSLNCSGDMLTGKAQHTLKDLPTEEFDVRGSCRNGRGEFKHNFKLKEYLGTQVITRTVKIVVVGVADSYARMIAFDETNEVVGRYRPARQK